MNYELMLQYATVAIGILLILVIALQPTQKTGLIGDATDVEKREKRGFELFLYKSTIVLIILFFTTAILYGMGIGGAF